MEIVNSTLEDIDTIFKLYDTAIAYQKTVSNKHWGNIEKSFIETEIEENRQFKIIINNEVACIFALTFNDEAFWGEKDKQPSIYIHRIVTNPSFRGSNFVTIIIEWAKKYAKENKRDFVRLDTWGDNEKLINYYKSCGFTHIETISLDNLEGLPTNYIKGTLALFEIKI